MPERRLDVWWEDKLVGRFAEVANNLAEFQYSEGYSGLPISVSMPVQSMPYQGREPYEFLLNLFPETGLGSLARQYRLDDQDTIGLIGELGRECAGALRIVPEGQPPEHGESGYELLTDIAFENWLQTRALQPLLRDNRGRTRLSLAGAQAKAALYFSDNDEPKVPLNGAATTHIVKPSMRGRLPNSAHVELFCIQLAKHLLPEGDVPDCDLWRGCLRIRRYDRPMVNGAVGRIHQEDFCQALAQGVGAKYENRASPPSPSMLARAMALIDILGDAGLVGSPAIEKNRLLRLVIFNVLIHNADAHLKNYSLLYQPQKGIRIAPLYDALCTAGLILKAEDMGAYARTEQQTTALSTDMGLRIGNQFEIQQVSSKDWEQFADDCGLTRRFMTNTVQSFSGQLLNELPVVADTVKQAYPETESAVDQTCMHIKRQAENIDAN